MTKEKWIFLLFAVLTVLAIGSIGVAVAERSLWIAIAGIIVMYAAMKGARGYRAKLESEGRHQTS
ncbi:hypothetical protein B0H94_102115 [Salsuginibacillus halophilus]|uniref:YlaF family protein n=1 Tax=Salsuginibacillus halophilus TaxID=517424 RepID=A0A2P8HX86_9BACI|nr:DUF5325 family protein [Salsuginibacillus halophilus]PSL50839.1 hypothetical protein B0H94_102115 [Salsuginibacillus halophilus]